ncbi:MAG: hypothetical protein ACP5VX_06725 [Thermogladius sp.]
MREVMIFVVGLVAVAITWLVAAILYYSLIPSLENSFYNAFNPASTYWSSYQSIRNSVDRIVNGLPYFLMFMLVFGSIAYAYRVATSQQSYYYY